MGDKQQREGHTLSATGSIFADEIPVIDLANPDTSLLINQVSFILRVVRGN